MIQRRGFLAGLGALLAAPAIIRTPGLIMPVKALRPVQWMVVKSITVTAGGPGTTASFRVDVEAFNAWEPAQGYTAGDIISLADPCNSEGYYERLTRERYGTNRPRLVVDSPIYADGLLKKLG